MATKPKPAKRGKDTTSSYRRIKREAEVRNAGLSFKKVIMHPDDGPAVREYAKKLYEGRGIYYKYTIKDSDH